MSLPPPQAPPQPRLSLVTVSYNRADDLRRTLASVQAQTLPRRQRQVVVVDALSTDGTPQILEAFATEIDTLICEADRGPYDGMNKGLAATTGQWVMFLNAGDSLASPDTLAQLADATGRCARHRPAVGLLYGDVRLAHPDGRVSYRRYPNLSARFLYRHTLCHQAILARRDVMHRTGGFDLAYRVCADFDWLCRAVYTINARAARAGFVTTVFGLDGLSSRQYAMHERLAIITRQMPLMAWLPLGVLDALTRLLSVGYGRPAGSAKLANHATNHTTGQRVGVWVRQWLSGRFVPPSSPT